ncbi:MAG: histidine kinase, partial [Leucobacter sp.]
MSQAEFPARRHSDRARLLVPVLVSLLVQVPASIWIPLRLGRHEPGPIALHAALAAAAAFALLCARRFPGQTIAVVSALALVDLLTVRLPGPPYLALAFAIVGAVLRGAAVWAVLSVVTAWATAILVASFGGRDWHPPLVVAATVALIACFAGGAFARGRRARFAALRAEEERRRRSAEEEERARIARELHDVIGHALSQITVQAGVGLHLFDRDPEQARTALAHVKETSKAALDEVRGVLGVLRDGEAPLVPQAELSAIPRLVANAEGPGFAVTLEDRLGGGEPSAATGFAAYRIVQEALTNAVRHAGAS